ncbi:T9SS type A sorting domain-containing protein, partial [Roseivirga sp. E12]|uniref:T9SS type A sorting domain-containing protein n=1 Tax=Roseivirga sp. E12 TaxID=2819237 RepID=UPI001ABC0D05
TVTDVDDTDPVFTSATTASFVENGTGTAYTAVATDANAITYSLGTSNDESLFDIDGSTGAVTFKSSPDFESPADADADNAYVLEVKANDGINTASQTVTITVTNDPEALLRVTGDLTVPNTALGLESTFDVTIHNDGDAELSITSISFPTAFIGSNLLTVAAMSSETLTITFSPTEAIVYSGDIVITTNGGVATLSVTAAGEIITSIADDKLDEKSIVLYPNPASDVLYVDLSEVLLPIKTVELVNSSGLKSHLITNPTEKIIRIDIRPFTSGVYLLRVSDGNSVVIKKVIIKR